MVSRRRSRSAHRPPSETSISVIVHPQFEPRLAALGIDMVRANLTVAREFLDSWRSLIRDQQNAILDALETQIAEAAPTEVLRARTPTLIGSDSGAVAFDAHWRNRRGSLDAFE